MPIHYTEEQIREIYLGIGLAIFAALVVVVLIVVLVVRLVKRRRRRQ